MQKEQAYDRPHRHHYDAEMLDVEEALERILTFFKPLSAEDVPLLEALGQVLAEPLVAPINIPPLDNSAMDGYAVRAADVAGADGGSPVGLRVIGHIPAGTVSDQTVEPGTALRIMTGAPVPEGADTVIAFEDTDEVERRDSGASMDAVYVRLAAEIGENIRPAAEDVLIGDTVLEAGTVLRASELGVAASLSLRSLPVIRRPVVAVLATGDELLEPGEAHEPAKIYNSNNYSVAASVSALGGIPRVIGVARDTESSVEEALARAMDSDMVITTAGVSKGDYDFVKDVLAKRGEIALWSVRMRPAKPLAFGALDAPDGRRVPHLGLPGNPVSALVAFEQFARPAMRKMMGKDMAPRPTVQAILDDPVTNFDGRRVYARVVVYRENGVYRARTTGNQSSGVLTSMARANGLAICPDDRARLSAGETATVQMLDWPEDVF
ncbi:MAG TPA: gephyrin-like molybdotransferase Glp [Dehalococcoidia bacterium]|jgi:molybdopterin molybdotransferase|nr:molybdopterin molybdenumtransferase MoeA [Chloroflexota bacterium]MDP5877656.1 molybdopterin molybdotransferase MoeA [Dehalococcoidia bacterium]MDP6272555.1 molybdopterin molybdotransferase MoeA [Dehalococcoidia bacterium]MDP7159663.1 molybdopterin molybdotransferase MoeA [Dehalococcoidia bacterium]MDP7212877.1 molybdopterin molybdotransferase MoeA [Dehalococcoidia bacterium]|tara:strand:+ start:5018 stop:6331 length:1314 start_codon:yes stop_codon:yes gene_type:complete